MKATLVALASLNGAAAFTAGVPAASPRVAMPAISMNADTTWDIKQITPDGSLVQRVEGLTRKTWKFNDLAKDRSFNVRNSYRRQPRV